MLQVVIEGWQQVSSSGSSSICQPHGPQQGSERVPPPCLLLLLLMCLRLLLLMRLLLLVVGGMERVCTAEDVFCGAVQQRLRGGGSSKREGVHGRNTARSESWTYWHTKVGVPHSSAPCTISTLTPNTNQRQQHQPQPASTNTAVNPTYLQGVGPHCVQDAALTTNHPSCCSNNNINQRLLPLPCCITTTISITAAA